MSSRIRKIFLEEVKKQQVNKEEHQLLRVAAYCRVSTEMDEQLTSFSMQVRAYEEKIKSTPSWEFAGVFADEGITGTSAEKRPQFLKMIEACEQGKIDLIITKSISRFARNTLECLSYAKHLQNIGVDIFFENDGIDTRNGGSKLLFTLLASFAEEESRSISENTKWGVRKRFEQGQTRWTKLYGYRKKASQGNKHGQELGQESEPTLSTDSSNGTCGTCGTGGSTGGAGSSIKTTFTVISPDGDIDIIEPSNSSKSSSPQVPKALTALTVLITVPDEQNSRTAASSVMIMRLNRLKPQSFRRFTVSMSMDVLSARYESISSKTKSQVQVGRISGSHK